MFTHFSHMLQASAARIKQVSHAPLFNIFVKTRWMTLCHSQHSVIVHTNHSTEDLQRIEQLMEQHEGGSRSGSFSFAM